MQAIGILVLIVGIALIVLAARRGGEAGTAATSGPPPPRPARMLMATGVLCVIAGGTLAIMAGI